ncbi:hypothetical protein BCR37DRAFT_224483 [Protomyces lactucae-debilis]|uniref:BTB domain-containing protein n=1 Tax=Protomyces lactucae-debilis TaxID=2754530 RepID=A0A1Y2ES21_PROLT|nr:uncharacterized protein BCR37DRAFT_224483 [Protomyces lactucae-debilis]ORY74383.1 hypothetical protein BCR37DRAFT_224483 [Protomyces lactucae-debilis]
MYMYCCCVTPEAHLHRRQRRPRTLIPSLQQLLSDALPLFQRSLATPTPISVIERAHTLQQFTAQSTMPGLTFGAHTAVDLIEDSDTVMRIPTKSSTQLDSTLCNSTDLIYTHKPRCSTDTSTCNFFVRLVPDASDKDKETPSDAAEVDEEEFSGIHAKALFASRVLGDMLRNVEVNRQEEVTIPMYGENKESLNRLLRWLFRSQLDSIFTFDRNIWKYARLADKYDIPLLRAEIEQFYTNTWPPGCDDLRSQFVIFNESCRYHLACRDSYLDVIKRHRVDFFKYVDMCLVAR